MYEKNLLGGVNLTLEFENGVATFIKRVKSQHAYIEDGKIKCPFQKCKNEVFKTSDR